MATDNSLRHKQIRNHMLRQPEKVAEVSIDIWEAIATEIISLVGAEGFVALYSRSLFLVQPSFPWLVDDAPSHNPPRFLQLKRCLAEQLPEQALAANIMLLITFTDILVALIGDPLTTNILRTVWCNVTSDTDKELKDE